MARVYYETPRGERKLAYLECDLCDARLLPGPDVAESGWEKLVIWENYPLGQVSVFHHCPEHRAT